MRVSAIIGGSLLLIVKGVLQILEARTDLKHTSIITFFYKCQHGLAVVCFFFSFFIEKPCRDPVFNLHRRSLEDLHHNLPQDLLEE